MTLSVLPILVPDAQGLSDAAQILRNGGLVAFPTETVYGLGADAKSDWAVAGIFAAKGRPSFNPLIVHVTDLAMARTIADFDDRALALARAFWPGPLTLVLPLRADAGISPLVTAGLPNVAVRVPAHPVAQALLRAFGGPLAAPSANPSGRISPTTAAHVVAGLSGRIDAVVDGGSCAVGVESTIIGPDLALLREGGISAEMIEAYLDRPLIRASDPARPVAPGQMASHYAPKGTIRLEARQAEPDEVFLGFGPGPAGLNLSPSGNLTEAAANLFGHLHRLDAMGAARIAVAPIPEQGLGRAINDRLRRAAAPRPAIDPS
jgi:L-threonylcarbamoyladenylate synthase